MKIAFWAFCLLLFVCVPSAFANPIDPWDHGRFAQVNAVALIVEAVVVAALLARRKFAFLRVFAAWLLVTYMTYWYMQGALNVSAALWDHLYGGPWLSLLALETLVVLIEAWVIVRMSEAKFFRDSETPFAKGWALTVSVAGNAASLALSLLWPYLLIEM